MQGFGCYVFSFGTQTPNIKPSANPLRPGLGARFSRLLMNQQQNPPKSTQKRPLPLVFSFLLSSPSQVLGLKNAKKMEDLLGFWTSKQQRTLQDIDKV